MWAHLVVTDKHGTTLPVAEVRHAYGSVDTAKQKLIQAYRTLKNGTFHNRNTYNGTVYNGIHTQSGSPSLIELVNVNDSQKFIGIGVTKFSFEYSREGRGRKDDGE